MPSEISTHSGAHTAASPGARRGAVVRTVGERYVAPMLLLLAVGCAPTSASLAPKPDTDAAADADTDTDADSDTDADADTDSDADADSDTATPLRLAIPAYAWPGDPAWSAFVDGAAARDGLVVANPNSGPGAGSDPVYVAAIAAAQARGVRVLGYVHTSYGLRAAADVDQEVSAWYGWYGVDGIFFDEVSDAAGCASTADWYAARAAVANGVDADGDAFIAYNPGTDSCETWMEQADLLVLFEDTAAVVRGWAPPAWTARWPAERFWLLAHTATAADLAALLDEARTHNIGWIYVTDDVLPNPWDAAPAWWDDEIAGAGRLL